MDLERQEELRARMREIAQRAREQLLRDLVEVLEIPAGRRLLHQLIADAGTYSTSYRASADGRGDALASAFEEGRRNQGIMLETLIGEADPEALIRMQVEHLTATRSARAQREAAERDASV